MAFVGSMGFGRAPFGSGPFGHGPWVTFPHTSDYGYAVEDAYAVDVARFGDGGEQRARRATQRARTLGFTFTTAASAEIADVRSFFMATEGPIWRFRTVEHVSGRSVVVRGPAGVPTALGGGTSQPRLAALRFTVERSITYAEEVRGRLAPSAWWRLSAPTGTTSFSRAVTFYDSGSPVLVEPMRVVVGVASQAPGLALADRAWSLRVGSTTLVATPPPTYRAGESSYQMTALVQLDWPPPSYRLQPVFTVCAASGVVFMVCVDSYGRLAVVNSGGVPYITASAALLSDNLPHAVAWKAARGGGGLQWLYLDGVGVHSVTGQPIPNEATYDITSLGIAGFPNSGQYLFGRVQDVTFRTNQSALTDVDVERLASARTR